MDMHKHHEQLLSGIYKQLRPIIDGSEQAIYVYLDDIHKFCNKKFAALMGYASPKQWASVEDSFPKFVSRGSQRTLINAYQKAMERFAGSTIRVTWNKKGGGQVKTNVILVPVMYSGHNFALHFVSKT